MPRWITVTVTILVLSVLCGLVTAAPAAAKAPRLLIAHVFHGHPRQAQRVAYCESHYDPRASSGQYQGLFQLSAAWRAYFRQLHPHWHDIAHTPLENIRAAHAIHLSHGWQPWSCGWAAYDPYAPR